VERKSSAPFSQLPVVPLGEIARQIGVGPAAVFGAIVRLNIKVHRAPNHRKLVTVEQANQIAAEIIG
jgi:hypothetical protein